MATLTIVTWPTASWLWRLMPRFLVCMVMMVVAMMMMMMMAGALTFLLG
jgi:hypothetical protein